MRLTKTLSKSLTSALFALVLLTSVLAPKAYAFSSFGDGSAELPFRIGNCAQLQEMNDDLTAHYTLIRNVDCQGFSFLSIASSSAFTGSLDGRGYGINSLMIDGGSFTCVGLFDDLEGTVTNLAMSNPVISGGNFVGALAGCATHAVVSKVHVTQPQIAGSGISNGIGGVIGNLDHSTLEQSLATGGSVTGTMNVGGLVGRDDVLGVIHDCFSDLTVTGNGEVGGVIGQIKPTAGLTSNVFSDGALLNTGANPSAFGGLVGLLNQAFGDPGITNSFSVARLYNLTTNNAVGGLIGQVNGPTPSDVYFDEGLGAVPGMPCIGSGGGGGSCTVVDAGGSDLYHFIGNHSAAPLDTWDFNSIWQVVDGSWPTLQPLSNFADGAVPNGGDANGDNQPDNVQTNVISVPNFDQVWSTIEVPGSSGCTVDYPMWANPAEADTGFNHPLSTMTGFSLYCDTPGITVPVTIIYDKKYDTTSWVLRYYSFTSDKYTSVPGAVFGTKTVGGIPKTTATYSVTDGGSFDSDGLPNGIIVDPVAPATAVQPPNTGLGESSDPATGTAVVILGVALLCVRRLIRAET